MDILHAYVTAQDTSDSRGEAGMYGEFRQCVKRSTEKCQEQFLESSTMTDVNKERTEWNLNVSSSPCLLLFKLPFWNHFGLLVAPVANFAGIKIPHTSHPSPKTSFVYIANCTRATAGCRYQVFTRSEANPTRWVLICIVVIVTVEPKCWHLFLNPRRFAHGKFWCWIFMKPSNDITMSFGMKVLSFRFDRT